jgi:hypothetical protein
MEKVGVDKLAELRLAKRDLVQKRKGFEKTASVNEMKQVDSELRNIETEIKRLENE